MTTSTHYVIRQLHAQREYYAGPHNWLDAPERAVRFEFMSTADCYAMIQLGLTDLDYTIECIAAIGT